MPLCLEGRNAANNTCGASLGGTTPERTRLDACPGLGLPAAGREGIEPSKPWFKARGANQHAPSKDPRRGARQDLLYTCTELPAKRSTRTSVLPLSQQHDPPLRFSASGTLSGHFPPPYCHTPYVGSRRPQEQFRHWLGSTVADPRSGGRDRTYVVMVQSHGGIPTTHPRMRGPWRGSPNVTIGYQGARPTMYRPKGGHASLLSYSAKESNLRPLDVSQVLSH